MSSPPRKKVERWEDLYGNDFGWSLENLRLDKEIGMRKLARMVGISSGYLNNIEKGLVGPPSDDVLTRMAAALKIDDLEFYLLAGWLPEKYRKICARNPHRVASLLKRASRRWKKSENPIPVS